MSATVSAQGQTFGWCEECKAWWVVLKRRLRAHDNWNGTVTRRCTGSGTAPTDPPTGRAW